MTTTPFICKITVREIGFALIITKSEGSYAKIMSRNEKNAKKSTAIKDCIAYQMFLHRHTEPCDIVKLCYQAAFGAEHLLSDIKRAREYFEKEFLDTPPTNEEIAEGISSDVCRVNIGAWKKNNLPAEWLFSLFLLSSEGICKTEDKNALFYDYIASARELMVEKDELFPFSTEQFDAFFEGYPSPPVAIHHSSRYREKEEPSYRIVSKALCRLIPILIRAKDFIGSEKCIIAIDGRAASGKTTMASALSRILSASVLYADDFFLPPSLRTPERFRAPGSNIHLERLTEEVVPYLRGDKPFSYRIFDCSIMDYNGRRSIEPSKFIIVEGSYSHHPLLRDYADIKVFSDVDKSEQLTRIISRNGKKMAEMFKKKWIPLEEEYFSAFSIKERSDLCV